MTMQKVYPVRLSHSTFDLFNRCERLFQLEKLMITDKVRDESADLSLGSAYGVGVAEYLTSQNKARAIYKAWLAYWPLIETEKKSVSHMVAALEASFSVLDNILKEYEIATFKGKPAAELSFRINLNPAYYYVGYIDFVLKNRFDGSYVVFDAKTTGLQLLDLSPLYQNSGQVLGYSIALDAIVGESLTTYSVGYLAAQLYKDMSVKVKPYIFKKSLLDRLNWLTTLGMDLSRLEQAEQLSFYPRRGDACMKYNRPCKHFGTCQMSSIDSARKIEEDPIEYDFVFELDSLIDDHIRRISE
jgi:hypothetical protein